MFNTTNKKLDEKLISIYDHLDIPVFNYNKNMNLNTLLTFHKIQKMRKQYYNFSNIYPSLNYFNRFI